MSYTPTLYQVRHITKTSSGFRQLLLEMCERLNLDPTAVASVMSFESGFDPAIRNKYSGATGLIQFMPRTARGLGTTTDELATMTAEEQLEYVEKYLKPYAPKAKTVADVYMTVFWPAAVGKDDAYVLTQQPKKSYKQNRALDQTGDGTITKAEAARFVVSIYDSAVRSGIVVAGVEQPPPNPPEPPGAEQGEEDTPVESIGILAVGAVMGHTLIRVWKALAKKLQSHRGKG